MIVFVLVIRLLINLLQNDIPFDGSAIDVDDHGTSAVELACTYPADGTVAGTVTSSQDLVGDWLAAVRCPSDYFLVGFRIRVLSSQGGSRYTGDDLSVTDIHFRCRGPGLTGNIHVGISGDGMNRGNWGDWSNTCDPGEAICAIQVKMEDCSTQIDCSTINDAKFTCCDF